MYIYQYTYVYTHIRHWEIHEFDLLQLTMAQRKSCVRACCKWYTYMTLFDYCTTQKLPRMEVHKAIGSINELTKVTINWLLKRIL